MAAAFCRSCGIRVEHGSKFCESCGARVDFEVQKAPVKSVKETDPVEENMEADPTETTGPYSPFKRAILAFKCRNET